MAQKSLAVVRQWGGGLRACLAGKKRIGALMLLSLCFSGSCAWGQAIPAGESRLYMGTSVSFGGMKTHVENFTFNSLGTDASVFFQSSPLRGLELRGGYYPLHARFTQAPVTGGLHFTSGQGRPNRMAIFGYIGGGVSRSQDAGPHYVATPAHWSPCWQVSQGIDLPTGRLRWKLYEATWTETYTPLRTLQSFSLTTGLSFIIR